jgi:signal transduction histidine kinase
VAVALDVAAVALLGWTTWTVAQSRERPSAWPFLALVGSLTAWAVFSLATELGREWVEVLSMVSPLGQVAAALAVQGALVLYALRYTGRGTGLTRRRIAMLVGIAGPALAAVAVVALGAAGVVSVDSEESVVVPAITGLLVWELLYVFALYWYAVYLLVGLAWRHDRVTGTQTAVLLGAVSAPYVASVAGSEGAVADGVTVGLLVAGVCLPVAVRRYPVMTGFPKSNYVARTRVVEALQEAVVVLDWDDAVIDANATAERLFDRTTSAMTGESVRTVADGLEGADLSAGTTDTVTLRTTEGRRQFQFSVSAVGGASDEERRPVARAVVFRDVTDQRTREQRLAVLNRILRHNVRNELDVVLAHADRIEDERVRAGVRDSATDLVALSEKARAAEEVMTASTDSPAAVDLVAVAGAVVEEYRGSEFDGDVSLGAPDELAVRSHRAVVRQVLSELVENALAHSESPDPRVEVRVREGTDATAELSVADDGPGIPERERAVVTGGREDQLEHGQGIGLWFVTWAVTQLGGDLAFDENDPEGTVVTVRLYGAECDAVPDREPARSRASR